MDKSSEHYFQDARSLAQTAEPKRGVLHQLMNRPKEGVHIPCDKLTLHPESGINGDRWINSAWLKASNGTPDPRIQVSLTNLAVMKCFASQANRPPFDCGDNLYTNLCLTEKNLPAGSLLQIGDVTLQVSDVENDACGKFATRFGSDAFKYIRTPKNHPLRLRGIFCQIIKAGTIRVNDTIIKT